MAQLKVGDVIRLKSGGPPMTIQSVGGDEKLNIFAVWFVDDKKEQGRFAANSLEIVTKSNGPAATVEDDEEILNT